MIIATPVYSKKSECIDKRLECNFFVGTFLINSVGDNCARKVYLCRFDVAIFLQYYDEIQRNS